MKKARFLLFSLVILSAFASSFAYLSTYDASAFENIAQSVLKQSNAGSDSILSAVSSLALLSRPLSDSSSLCQSGTKLLSQDLNSVFIGLKLRSSLNCPSVKIPESAVNKIEEALEKSTDSVSQLLALCSASLLSAKGINKDKVSDAINEVIERISTDGFKIHEDAENGSGYFAGLALEAFAGLSSVMTPEQKTQMSEDVAEAMKGYLTSSGEQDEKVLFFRHSDSSVDETRATSTLLSGLTKFIKAFTVKIPLTDAMINKLASFLLDNKTFSVTVEQVYSTVQGLTSLNSGTWKKPVVLTASQTTLKTSSKGDDSMIRFEVTDVFGKVALTSPKVFLTSLASTESLSSNLITNQELTLSGTSQNVYDFNFLAIKPVPGNYKMVLAVNPSKTDASKWTSIKSTTRYVKVISSIEVSEIQVAVSKSSQIEDATFKQSFAIDSKTIEKPIPIAKDGHLLFSFSIKNKATSKPMTVQQTFVLLTRDENDLFFVAKFDNSKKSYNLDIAIDKHLNQLESGKYTIKLLIGDSYIENSIQLEIGTLDINLGAQNQDSKKNNTTNNKKNTIGGAPAFLKKPEIHHKFRPAEKRADVFVSRTFTLLTIAPFGIFIIGMMFIGLNFGNCPSGLGMLWALAFHACIVGIAYILWLFFYQNNLLETLKLLMYAAIPTIFIGHRALRAIALKRSESLKKD